MIVWRLKKKKYIDTAFSGHGASLTPGRWNPAGFPVVYLSATLSLAALEKLVATRKSSYLFKIRMMAISAAIPNRLKIERIEVESLPRNWRGYGPSPPELQNIGAEWLKSGRAAVLRVPSAVVPIEYNYLLNPRHDEFSKIAIHKPEPFQFDPRLFK